MDFSGIKLQFHYCDLNQDTPQINLIYLLILLYVLYQKNCINDHKVYLKSKVYPFFLYCTFLNSQKGMASTLKALVVFALIVAVIILETRNVKFQFHFSPLDSLVRPLHLFIFTKHKIRDWNVITEYLYFQK